MFSLHKVAAGLNPNDVKKEADSFLKAKESEVAGLIAEFKKIAPGYPCICKLPRYKKLIEEVKKATSLLELNETKKLLNAFLEEQKKRLAEKTLPRLDRLNKAAALSNLKLQKAAIDRLILEFAHYEESKEVASRQQDGEKIINEFTKMATEEKSEELNSANAHNLQIYIERLEIDLLQIKIKKIHELKAKLPTADAKLAAATFLPPQDKKKFDLAAIKKKLGSEFETLKKEYLQLKIRPIREAIEKLPDKVNLLLTLKNLQLSLKIMFNKANLENLDKFIAKVNQHQTQAATLTVDSTTAAARKSP